MATATEAPEHVRVIHVGVVPGNTGWLVSAMSEDEQFRYVCNTIFQNEGEAQALAERVRAAGHIDRALWWSEYQATTEERAQEAFEDECNDRLLFGARFP